MNDDIYDAFITIKTDQFIAEYHGGPYITLYSHRGGLGYDCINVWDYETDKATIPFTVKGVARAVASLAADDSRRFPNQYL